MKENWSETLRNEEIRRCGVREARLHQVIRRDEGELVTGHRHYGMKRSEDVGW